ncbi:O-antigen ligase family protein [Cryobacterium sp. Hb1]|uniref:O-antigen ligase family protein n=1 Tax=Cryobacterium sp. Hb1 TaxID=1259147 RepID=UPI001F54635F|nr:O-antigen ligase family protein [Cryobacterium sp. Hb1]
MSRTVPAKRMPQRGAPRPVLVPPGRRRAATVALWLLVASSIFFLPDAFVRWFLPKDALAAIAVVLASVGVARGRLPRWFVAAASAALAVALLSVLISAAPGVQLWGRWPRYEGLVTLPVYFGAVWTGARLLGPAAPTDTLRTLIRAIATAAIALGLVSLLEAAGARPIATDLARPGSLTGNATDQGVLGAIFCAMLILPVLRAWTEPRKAFAERAWLSTALLLAAATVIVSASRAGLLAAVTVLGILMVLEIVRSPGRRRLRPIGLTALAGVVLIGGALAVPFTRSRLLGASPLSTQSLEGRFTFWSDAIDVLTERPLGVGVSGFLNANSRNSTSDSVLDSPHNWVIQVLLAGGIPLLAVVVGLLVTAAVIGLRSWRRLCVPEPVSAAARRSTSGLVPADAARSDVLAGALAALGGFGVALLTHFTAPSTTIVAALLLGVLVTRAPDGELRVQMRPGSPRLAAATVARTAILGVWSIWLVILVSAEIPLASGVSHAARGDIQAAESAFEAAHAIRPWDADLAGIAAQSFAAAADARVPEAAALAVHWAELSRAALPQTATTERALAVGQFTDGDVPGAVKTLDALVELAPMDPTIAVQNAIVLYTNGDTDDARREVKRALALDPTNDVALQLEEILRHE